MHQHHITVGVSRAAFGSNIRYLRTQLAPSRLCVVLKANAYGHGLRGLAPAAIEAGADYLGICTNPEAWQIRDIDESIPILRLRTALPEELDESVKRLHIEELVGSMEAAEYLDHAGRKRGKAVPVHIKIDTGMGRTGFFPEQLDKIKRACGLPGLKIRGIMTHLAKADAANLDNAKLQLDAFRKLMEKLNENLPDDVLRHTHNSAACVRLPGDRGDLVRVGAACYGVRTSQHFSNPAELRPVMSIRTRIAEVRRVPAGKTIGYGGLFNTARESVIASLPVGFGEGYPRALFNKGIVLIRGKRCPVVGRVSLNVITVDISDLGENVGWGEDVVLIGSQGDEEVTFEEMADLFDSVHTEINLMAGSMNEVIFS